MRNPTADAVLRRETRDPGFPESLRSELIHDGVDVH